MYYNQPKCFGCFNGTFSIKQAKKFGCCSTSSTSSSAAPVVSFGSIIPTFLWCLQGQMTCLRFILEILFISSRPNIQFLMVKFSATDIRQKYIQPEGGVVHKVRLQIKWVGGCVKEMSTLPKV